MERRASQIERSGTELSQAAAEKGAMASRRISDILRRAADDISDVDSESYKNKLMGNVRGHMETVRGHVDTMREHIDERSETAREEIREHPLASVAVAVGVGFMAGAAISMLGSRMYYEYRD